MGVEIGITAHPIAHQPGDFMITLGLEEYVGPKSVRKLITQEPVSNYDAHRILTDLRDMADRALRQHWPRETPKGRHEKERSADV